MAIEFSCSACGKHLRAPHGAEGRQCRCPDCGVVATVPDDGPPPLPFVVANETDVDGSAQTAGRESETDAESGTILGLPKSTAQIVGGIAGVVVILIAGIGYYGYSSSQKKMEGRNRLKQQAAQQIQAAEQKTNEYDFIAAQKLLYELREEIQASSYVDVATEDKLIADIDAAYDAISDKQSNFFRKKQKAWTIFEGEFISPEQKKNILSARADLELQKQTALKNQRIEQLKREEERRRAQAEQERIEGERQRQELEDFYKNAIDLSNSDNDKRFYRAFMGDNYGRVDNIARARAQQQRYRILFAPPPAERPGGVRWNMCIGAVTWDDRTQTAKIGVGFAYVAVLDFKHGITGVIEIEDWDLSQTDHWRRVLESGTGRLEVVFEISSVADKRIGDSVEVTLVLTPLRWRIASP